VVCAIVLVSKFCRNLFALLYSRSVNVHAAMSRIVTSAPPPRPAATLWFNNRSGTPSVRWTVLTVGIYPTVCILVGDAAPTITSPRAAVVCVGDRSDAQHHGEEETHAHCPFMGQGTVPVTRRTPVHLLGCCCLAAAAAQCCDAAAAAATTACTAVPVVDQTSGIQNHTAEHVLV
jgi:hypothetical protein